MTNRYKIAIVFAILFSFLLLFLTHRCFAQRRIQGIGSEGRRRYGETYIELSYLKGDQEDDPLIRSGSFGVGFILNGPPSPTGDKEGDSSTPSRRAGDFRLISAEGGFPVKISQPDPEVHNEGIRPGRIRTYDMSLDLGLGNFVYEEHGLSGDLGKQSFYTGDMFSFKGSVRIMETKGKWAIDIGGEVFGTTQRLERWWSGQKLFRVNKLFAKGLCMDTIIRYSFEEMGLAPFPVLAEPNLGFGLVYRFYGLRRQNTVDLIENNALIPKEIDFALFGLEPTIGLYLTMEDGGTIGYVDVGTGLYGASVEKSYVAAKGGPTSPDKTYARSVLAKIGLKGRLRKISYNVGYSIVRFKITAKKAVPDTRINLNRIVCDIGMRF